MTPPSDEAQLCPQLGPEALAILLDHELPYAQRCVLLAHLADPTLSVTDLARAVGCAREVARKALVRAPMASQMPSPLANSDATDGISDATRDTSDATRASRARPRVTSLSFGEIEHAPPSGDHVVGDDTDAEDPPPDLVLQEPRANGKAKPRTLAHDTGLSTAELAALARRVLAERRAAELTTPAGFRAEDNRSLRSMLAGFLRDKDPTTGARVVDPDRLVAACAATASLSSKAIAWQLNADRTTEAKPRKRGGVMPASTDQAAWEREAAEARANGYRSRQVTEVPSLAY
jgi:hypothetical protein